MKNELEELKKAHQDLISKYDEAVAALKKERALSERMMHINQKISKQNIDTVGAYYKVEGELERYRSINKKGIFFEYDNDPNTMSFTPILGDIQKFKDSEKKPTRLMYTFKFSDIQNWLFDLHEIMGKNEKHIHRFDPEDL